MEVFLPEMSSAKTVELDVEEKKLTLESTEPAKYRLVVNFAYPVDEEKGSAKFDRSTHKLVVTLPVKNVASVARLTSTDSGDPELNAEMEVRSLTGVGAEKATHH